MPNKWKIKNSNDVTGGKDKADLVGCFINENASGTAYQFNSPNPNSTVLAATPGPSLPSTPFTFPLSQVYDGYQWTITVNTFTGGANGDDATGTWTNTDPSLDNEESGDWTAQADATVDDFGKDQADAASA